MQRPQTPGPESRREPAGLERAARILGRAARRRCPNCGGGDVFRSYLHQRTSCPRCGLRLDRGERDFFIGAYTINLIVAELVVVAGALGVALWTWPAVPWTGLTWGLAALMVIVPILLYPVSRQLWLGFDLIFQPPRVSDFEDVEFDDRGGATPRHRVDNSLDGPSHGMRGRTE